MLRVQGLPRVTVADLKPIDIIRLSGASLVIAMLLVGWWGIFGITGDQNILNRAIAGGALSREYLTAEPWRIISAPLLHLHAVHLATNLLFCGLLSIGCSLNRSMRSTVSLFFISGWFATVVGVLTQPGWFLGASGAMFGLLGAIIASHRRALSNGRLLLVSVVAICVSLLSKGDAVAHVAGLVSGAVIGDFDIFRRDRASHFILTIACLGIGYGLYQLT
ncbi:MAG: hypothetical protein CMH52_11310 [Myxococcales bacterium]|nr:hypothetical protein [Myxococcales bacterium]|tara:strand:- start:2337 stop:2996 length:660 start_codon:yes stop_codon:yes gene_type:complete